MTAFLIKKTIDLIFEKTKFSTIKSPEHPVT